MSPEYASVGGVTSVMSGGSLGLRGGQLPDLKKVHSGSREGTNQTIQVEGGPKLRKASPEALALMMANMKKNEAASSSSSHWVPGGKALPRDNSRQRKLFY